MSSFQHVRGRFITFGPDVSKEDTSLALVHSISKQLLEELHHARHGLDPREIGHVTAELGKLIIALRESEQVAEHAINAWHHMQGTSRSKLEVIERILVKGAKQEHKYLQYLKKTHEHLNRWGERSISELKELLESLNMYSKHLHDELHVHMLKMQLPEFTNAAYRPPHHGGAQ